ncbi:MAG: isocitrate lyase/PEP mutase family protein [Chloroflexi bacterium]|nr:isocitrate lyase/PEP mutase family protein [Chloroflexota bacterium]
MPQKKTTRLKELFNGPRIFVFAGGSSPLEAKIAESIGFEAFYMSGGNTSMAVVGWPDVGVTSMRELVDNAYRIASSVNIPVYSDADTGYGNAIAVYRTVQEFIRAGVAGVHLEDQEFPKRSGSMAGRRVISLEEAAGKLRAAVDAKMELDPDFQIVARCDARGAEGGSVEEVIKRLQAYKKAGADVVYFEQPSSLDEVRAVRKAVAGPLLCNMRTELVGGPLPPAEEWQKLGLAAVWLGGKYSLAPRQAIWEFFNDLKERGVQAYNDLYDRAHKSKWGCVDDAPVFSIRRIREMEEKYLPKDLQRDYTRTIGRRE